MVSLNSLKALQLVDRQPFRHLLKYLRPSLKESDIPHCTKIHEEIMKRANTAELQVRESLSRVKSLVSFTFDSWTSASLEPFLSVTCHYIASTGKPGDWQLKTNQLAFTRIQGNHSGANICSMLVHTVDRYNLHNKVT
jgi:hypothetical protein